MHREGFDNIWVPRLGASGADTLWRYRRKTPLYMASPLLAAGGSTLLTVGGALGAVCGVALLLLAFGLVADFFLGKKRLKALMSERFGVTVKGVPAMNQRSFDRWCKYNRYEQPD